MAKKRRRAKIIYHTFKRRMPDRPEMIHTTKAIILGTTQAVTIRLTIEDVDRALALNGQADSQNCAGAVCVLNHADQFNHIVSSLVDWWRHRVYILGKQRRNGQNVCHVYAHYDNIEELFDTIAGLKKLKRRIAREGFIDITLHPVKHGISPKTGRTTHRPSGGGKGGAHRGAMIGGDLRWMNYITARKG
jgi:hypothetical protein